MVQLKGNIASTRDYFSSDHLVSIESWDESLATRLAISNLQEVDEWRLSDV